MMFLVCLCYFVYTLLTSFVLSLILLIRYCLSRFWLGSTASTKDDSISLYQGTVCHERRHPVHQLFKFSVRYALIDLDHASSVPPNHLSAQEARSVARTNGPVLLLTIPPSVGLQRIPVTLYYCYDIEEDSSVNLKLCIVEVSNTPWGEQVQFTFNPNSDLAAKSLHVSPFMDMLGDWEMKTRSPGKDLYVRIRVKHPELGNYFTASLTAKRVSSFTSKTDYALFFWLMPHKVAVYTYWQCLKLVLKNVPFNEHPKYKNPEYIQESLMAAEKRGCCMAFLGNSHNNHNNIQTIDRRWYVWQSSKWPWN